MGGVGLQPLLQGLLFRLAEPVLFVLAHHPGDGGLP